jgi:copper(I)-binding protein
MILRGVLLVVAVASIVATATAQTGVSVDQGWARATPGAATIGAAYLVIANPTASADRVIAISSPIADRVEIHQHFLDGDVMRMREVPNVEIGPGETVAFKPGGLHLMLIKLKHPLRQGDRFPLTVKLERAGEIRVDVTVLSVGAKGPSS